MLLLFDDDEEEGFRNNLLAALASPTMLESPAAASGVPTSRSCLIVLARKLANSDPNTVAVMGSVVVVVGDEGEAERC